LDASGGPGATHGRPFGRCLRVASHVALSLSREPLYRPLPLAAPVGSVPCMSEPRNRRPIRTAKSDVRVPRFHGESRRSCFLCQVGGLSAAKPHRTDRTMGRPQRPPHNGHGTETKDGRRRSAALLRAGAQKPRTRLELVTPSFPWTGGRLRSRSPWFVFRATAPRPGGWGSVWIQPTGELDLATCPLFEQVLKEAQDDASIVSIDLQELVFIDCAGLMVIVHAAARAAATKRRLILIGAAGQVERLFDVTGPLRTVEMVKFDRTQTLRSTPSARYIAPQNATNLERAQAPELQGGSL
jgi:anti-anti-sigma factor